MKDASTYPITFGYKATDGQYYGPNGSIGPYHRGEDRAMPNGTPVIVNGVTIGISNNTGASSGPHLHIGRFVNGQDTAPNSGGFKFSSAVVSDIGNNASNGNFVFLSADGAIWVYLHLQTILVKQGQIIGGGYMLPPINEGDVKNAWLAIRKMAAGANDIAYWIGDDHKNDWKGFDYENQKFAQENLVLKSATATVLKSGEYLVN